jgi:glycerophosphoryl diester phosphodiesterase
MKIFKLNESLATKSLIKIAMIALFSVAAVSSSAWAERAGNKEIAAHAGDRESMPNGWKEDEWENSIQAIHTAFLKKPRWVEIDAQLNTHTSSFTVGTPHGILFAHHNSTCEEINTQGQGTGVFRNIRTDDPKLVRLCAERLDNLLAKYRLPLYRGSRFIIEMKNDDDPYGKVALPKAIYHLLKQRGERTSNIVSSIEEDLLIALRDLGRADKTAPCSTTSGCTIPLMRVFGLLTNPSNADFDKVKSLGFRYVAVPLRYWDTAKHKHARDIGLYTGGWHWGFHGNPDFSVEAANQKAASLDLDIFITDSISNFRTNYPAWK